MPLPEAKPMKPAEYTEDRILHAILEHRYGPGEALPGERDLALSLGVTRPTVREALQRLSREGWVTIAHGKPTRVNDYLAQGGLGLLATLARYGSHLSHGLVSHLLEARTLILPRAAALAAQKAGPEVLALLDPLPAALDGEDPAAFAAFDWALQKEMVNRAGNPVLRMIYNDFQPMYLVMGVRYFSSPDAREASLAYYRALASALGTDPLEVEALVTRTMDQACKLWEQMG